MPTSAARLLTLVLPALLGPAAAGSPPERGPMPHLVDLYGDPLPDGAVARLGSVRLRHPGLEDFVLLGDSKTAVTVGEDQMVRWWDLTTGRQARSIRLLGLEYSGQFIFSPDGTLVATRVNDEVTLRDTSSGRIVQTLRLPSESVDCLTFSPDGSVLAVGITDNTVTLVDRKSGRQRQVRLAAPPPKRAKGLPRPFLRVGYSRDGRRLAVAGIDGSPGVAVIDAASGKHVFGRDGLVIAAALSADGSRLALLTYKDNDEANDPVLRQFDVGTGKEVGGARWGPGLDCRFLTFSPDGKTLAVTAGRGPGFLLDTSTGRVTHHLPPGLSRPAFTPDGQVLIAQNGIRLRLWDVTPGRERYGRPSLFPYSPRAVTPNGRFLAVEGNEDWKIDLWDLGNGRLVRGLPWSAREHTSLDLKFTQNGRTLRSCTTPGVIRSWAVQTGFAAPSVRVWLTDQPGGPWPDYRMSPDGRRVAAVVYPPGESDRPGRLDVWDAADGQVIHRHRLPSLKWPLATDWLPDGSAVVLRVEGGIAFVDPDTGRVGVRIPAEGILQFSVDGRLLAARQTGDTSERDKVHVWEVASGREVAFVAPTSGVYRAWDLAPAARALVMADGRTLRVVDLATGRDRGRRTLPDLGFGDIGDRPVPELQVLPGDRRALTMLEDETVLVWDLSAFLAPRLADKHGERELTAWWADLAGDDARRAYAAGWKLPEAPPDAVVPFLRDRLKPAPAPDPKEVRRLIADLDSPTFVVREAAARRLGQLGPAVVPAVQAGLKKAESAEARERLEKLLERLSDPVPPAESLRAVRAVAVLERVGTADARRVLEGLARGADAAPETKAARSALGRMSWGWGG